MGVYCLACGRVRCGGFWCARCRASVELVPAATATVLQEGAEVSDPILDGPGVKKEAGRGSGLGRDADTKSRRKEVIRRAAKR